MDVASLQSANERVEREKRNSSSSLSAALSRSLASSLSFYFSRPIRLFRVRSDLSCASVSHRKQPTKVSAFTAVQALAHERGQALSPTTVRAILKEEGWRFFPKHVLPPFVANTLIGFTLFLSYSSADFVFRSVPHPLPEPVVPFVCGALAGSAQAIISSPLDNVRMLLSKRAEGARFTWGKIMKEALFPVFLVGAPEGESKSRFGQLRHLTRWASRGWSLYALSLTRDALGFGMFFAIFEQGRKVAKRAGNGIDEALASKTWPKWLTGRNDEEKKSRGWIGRTAQAFVLVTGGTLAGLAYGVIGRVRRALTPMLIVLVTDAQPFDVARREIWQGRMTWAEKEGLGGAKKAAPVEAPAPPRNRFERIFGSSFLKRRSTPQPQLPELPSARSLIREAIKRDGLRVFFISPTRAASSRLDSHPALGGASVFTPGSKPRASVPAASPRGLGGSIVRFFTIVPPYSLAFLAYAVASGDLST